MTPREVAALQEVLAAEHAVVYGYGVAGAHLDGVAQDRARREWERHRSGRDGLVLLLSEHEVQAEPAAATYALPAPVETPTDARLLATLLEERLAAVYADAVLDLRGDLRELAVAGLRDAAVAATGWRGSSVAFPGLAERSG